MKSTHPSTVRCTEIEPLVLSINFDNNTIYYVTLGSTNKFVEHSRVP